MNSFSLGASKRIWGSKMVNLWQQGYASDYLVIELNLHFG